MFLYLKYMNIPLINFLQVHRKKNPSGRCSISIPLNVIFHKIKNRYTTKHRFSFLGKTDMRNHCIKVLLLLTLWYLEKHYSLPLLVIEIKEEESWKYTQIENNIIHFLFLLVLLLLMLMLNERVELL